MTAPDKQVEALVIFGAAKPGAVLGDVVPVHPCERGTWGPAEADRLLPPDDAWHNPAA